MCDLQKKGESHHFFSLSRHLSTSLEESGFPANEFKPKQFWLERALASWWVEPAMPLLHCSCHCQQRVPQEIPVVSLSRLSVRLKRTSVKCPHVRTKREPLLWSGPFAFQVAKRGLRKVQHCALRNLEAELRLLASFSVQAAHRPPGPRHPPAGSA